MSLVRRTPVADPAGRPRALPELALVVGLFLAYKLARLLIQGRDDAAFGNAWRIWDLERFLHLPGEVAVQHAVVGQPALLEAANTYYAYVHFPVTAAFLFWMFLRRPAYYRWARRGLAGLTAAAMVVHVLLPLAPPRMLTATGMLDTGRLFGPMVYGDPATDTLTNQYAAMPSLHVGWALLVAVTLIAVTRGPWRWAWLAHPALTLPVVVVTGNHYWLDGIVAAALLAVVLLVCPWPGRQPHAFFGRAVPQPAVAAVEQPA
ncbi:phosphatase PAP2 family protein [Actinoplanes auranticolor]|uniref:Inositol phosphorylceramide synthase n=1 Tax=Actinoplanes auranticolor TaxID=47988 RepID=A0A919VPT1_9ACTN|nr:phosphatase PAP2 family protein [Actinoplanes auranticolor]GIM64491.1 inositol phosphorylceramide synthase [Actinoplanes auranticolor]